MNALAKLFGSSARLKILRLFIFNKEMSFTALAVLSRTALSKETVRRELSDLCAIGVLRKKGARTSLVYQVNQRFEHLEALDVFIRTTTTVQPQAMTTALRRAGTLRLVALSGFFMGITESQVDLLVVGDHLEERVLSSVVRGFEAELGREIRYATFTTEDYRYRHGVYDRLLRDVFDYPHRLLVDKLGL